MFITDRDLLAYEPNLFRDVAWLGQRLDAGVGGLTAGVLTAFASNFVSLGVTTGHVVVVGGVTLEVLARTSATTLTVSRIRASVDDAAIVPPDAASIEYSIWTLRPQIALAHAQIIGMLGLEAARAAAAPGQVYVDESRITNPRDLARLEALMTLHTAYSALAALRTRDDPAAARAQMYQDRVRCERARAVAYLDTDFDGRADVARRLNVVVMSR